MNLDFVQVFSNLVGLFLIIAVGYGAVQLGVISREISGGLSKLLMQVAVPCTVFTSLLRPYDPAFLQTVVIILILGLILFPLNALVARPLAKFFRVPEGRRGVWTFCATFCNSGFMGFPIALALFGEEGLSMAVVLNIAFNILVYSMGIRMICEDRSAGKSGARLQCRTILFTSINFSTVLGLIFYFNQLSVPAALLTPLTHLSNITTPLSMLVTGINLSNGKWSELLHSRDAVTASVTRLVICPVVTLLILQVVRIPLPYQDPLIPGVIFIILSMPTPAVATILAENYGVDQEFAALVVFISSLFCLATIPVMSMLI